MAINRRRENRLNGLFPLAYTGVIPVSPSNFIQDNRPPTPYDSKNFYIGDFWLDITSDVSPGYVAPTINNLWVLVSQDKGLATWISFGSGGIAAQSFVTDDGTATPNSSGIVNIITDLAANDAGITTLFTGTSNTVQFENTDSHGNVNFGKTSGKTGQSGSRNSGFGSTTLSSMTTGSDNTALGFGALNAQTTGSENVAIGSAALLNLADGGANIAIGFDAGDAYTTTESDNIVIGNAGVVTESNVIRIGTNGGGAGQQSSCFVAGIDGVNVGSVATVVTESGNQLGTAVLTAGSNITITPGANTITIAASSTSGALVKIQTQTASGVTTLAFTTGITSTYNNYLLIYDNFNSSTVSALYGIDVQISTNGGSTWITSGYDNAGITGLSITPNNAITTAYYASGYSDLLNLTLGSKYIMSYSAGTVLDPGTGSAGPMAATPGVYLTANTIVNAIRLIIDGTNTFSCVATLYGYVN